MADIRIVGVLIYKKQNNCTTNKKFKCKSIMFTLKNVSGEK